MHTNRNGKHKITGLKERKNVKNYERGRGETCIKRLNIDLCLIFCLDTLCNMEF